MEESTNRKIRAKITMDVLKSVRHSLKNEFTLKEIAEEAEISISCARSLSVDVEMGKTDEEIINIKKVTSIIDIDPDHTTRSIKEKLAANNKIVSISTISRIIQENASL
ncbi:hypothetical protein HZS_5462 [Henneguya salminicola]|nr:hypothetical protein HZS_5462 [Henneguya salminicola]